MKFITVRDLAVKNKKTRQIISREDSVLTLNGKPIAYMLPINEDNFEFVVNEAMRIKAAAAFGRMQKKGAHGGIGEKEGLKEIQEYRADKRSARKKTK